MVTRRNFLRSALAAPFVVKSGVLMPVQTLIGGPGLIEPGEYVMKFVKADLDTGYLTFTAEAEADVRQPFRFVIDT